MAVTVDIHGSCVSRNCFESVDKALIQVKHYYARNHIVSCMMPPANLTFSHGELEKYNSQYSENCMALALNKQTLPLLLASDSDYIIIDFFDFCQPVAAFFDTTFSTYDYTFYNTSAYRANQEAFKVIDFLSVPKCLWYGYVDAYFQKIAEKFHNRIILNRLRCSSVYMSAAHRIQDIPETLLPYGAAKYNDMIYDLENYVIDKYHPHIVDISKYFIPDEAHNPDTTAVHYENDYEILQAELMRQILLGNREKRGRYLDALPPLITARLLERPVSDADFLKIYQTRKLPFTSDSLLGYILSNTELGEIAKNRRWVAALYKKYDSIQDEIRFETNALHPLLTDTGLWDRMDISPFKQSVFLYLTQAHAFLQLPVSKLYRQFLQDFEDGNSYQWIIELKILSLLAPDYQDVSFYLSQFYKATDDAYSMRKLLNPVL